MNNNFTFYSRLIQKDFVPFEISSNWVQKRGNIIFVQKNLDCKQLLIFANRVQCALVDKSE